MTNSSINVTVGTGVVKAIAGDLISSTLHQALKMEYGDEGSATYVSASNPLPSTIINALPAGTNLIGKTGIDQTTPGTTNGVVITTALPAGTNGIGKLTANAGVVIGDVNIITGQTGVTGGTGVVGAATQRVTLATDIALPSGSNSIGTVIQANTTSNIGAALQTDVIMNNLTALTPKFAAIAASSNGNNTIVAAVTSKKIRVLQYVLVSNGTVNAKWQSGAGGTDLTGLLYEISNTGVSSAFSPVGLFETASGVLLNLNLSAGTAVGGHLIYVEV